MYTLYYKPTCPFCQKVTSFAESQHIPLELIDVTEPGRAEELIQIGGKKMVPFLIDADNEVMMYESGDIIDHLKNNITG